MIDLLDLELRAPAGGTSTLRAVSSGRPAVVVFLRHFG